MRAQAVVLAAFVAAGCSGTFFKSAHIEDKQLGHASAEQYDELAAADRRVAAANANVTAGRRSVDEARQFQGVARKERQGAYALLDAGRKAFDLANRTNDEAARASAGTRIEQGQRQMVAADAKQTYADQLLQLRFARLNEANAELEVARSRVEMIKLRIAEGNRVVKQAAAIRARAARAADWLAQARKRTQQEVAMTERTRQAWLERRSSMQSASRLEPTLDAPAAPAHAE